MRPLGPVLGPTHLEPGTLVGRFRVCSVLGQGGQGIVYRGEHLTLGYPVAIKVLHAGCEASEASRARFRREARLGAELRHRHIVSVIEAGELADGSAYLVMDYVEGVSLADVLDGGRAVLPLEATVELGVQLLAALAALDSRCILHRDIKPENIMLERAIDGEVVAKLLDFGISKATDAALRSRTLTQTGTVVGTPQYMSPEHVQGGELDVRADLYAVAAVLYECVLGVPPHDAPTIAAVFAKIAGGPPRPLRELAPECPEAVTSIIDRGLTPREERWRGPRQMAEALRAAARELGLARGADAWIDVLEGEGPATRSRVEPRATPARPADVTHPAAPRSEADAPTGGLEGARRSRTAWLIGGASIAAGLLVALWSALAPEAPTTDAGSWGVETAAAQPSPVAPLEVPQAEVASADPGAKVRQAANRRTEPSREADPPDPSPDELGGRRAREAARSAAPSGRTAAHRASDHALETSLGELERVARESFVRGDSDEATRLYRRIIAASPRRASAWRGLGLVAAATGDSRTAHRALRRYLRLAPEARDRARIERQLVGMR